MRFVLLLAVLTSACANPLAPEAPQIAPVASTPRWVLSGQSNAVNLKPYLTPYATILGVQQNSTPIRAWAVDGPLWGPLAAELNPSDQAFIWWQGEMDAYEGSTTYATDLRALLTRVRSAGLQTLVIVGLADMPDARYAANYATIRAIQQQIAGELGARYVSSERLPIDPDSIFHLTPDGYAQMAARLLPVLH
jgi:hypothetical protein